MSTSPELLAENWHRLKVGGDKFYLLKCLFNESDYELLLFHLNDCHLYYEKKSADDIEKYLHKYNSSIEAPISKINIHLKNCFVFDAESCEFTEKKYGSDLVLTMVSKLAGIKFNWKFELELLNLNAIKEHLVLPLIFNFAESQMRENELCRIIQNKDKEIDDYKSQGVKLSRKYLETEVFSKDNFNAMVNKRKADQMDQPEEALVSKLAHTVQNSCAIKYYNRSAASKRDATQVATNIDADIKVKTTTTAASQQESSVDTQAKDEKELSRLEKLKQELKEKEEAKQKQTTPKKKKLMK